MTPRRPPINRRSRLLLLTLPCLLLFGCGASPRRLAAGKIADALPAALGPADHYAVRVDGGPLDLARGRARHVHVDGKQVQVTSSIRLDALTLDAHGVQFDTKAKHLERADSADAVAVMGQENLTAYLQKAKPKLTGLKVTLRKRDAEGQIPITVLGLSTTVTLTGIPTVSASGADKLDFTATEASIGRIPVPAAAVNLALRQINPLLDLSTLRYPLAVRQASIESGHIVVRGTVDLSAERVRRNR